MNEIKDFEFEQKTATEASLLETCRLFKENEVEYKRAYELIFMENSALKNKLEIAMKHLTAAVDNPEDSAYWLGTAEAFVRSQQ